MGPRRADIAALVGWLAKPSLDLRSSLAPGAASCAPFNDYINSAPPTPPSEEPVSSA